MEPDFSGWATKAGLKCSDGRTILPDAFKHQDKTQVPLVWQHGHTDPENVLGHAILENRDEGVYAYGYFNKSAKAEHARTLVEHKDINMMSIWANDLIERSKRVLHGAIREVSLVLSGANPGAIIENVTIRHGDMSEDVLEDEALIYTGLEFEHAAGSSSGSGGGAGGGGGGDKTIQDVYDSMTDEQKQVLHFMIGEALDSAGSGSMSQSDIEDAIAHAGDLGEDATVQEVFDSMNDQQKEVLHFMVGEALASAGGSAGHSALGDDKDNKDNKKGDEVTHHNIFEQKETANVPQRKVLSHDDINSIVHNAKENTKSFKAAVQEYALSHGIEDIDILFPDARAIDSAPELISRRMEWVNKLLAGVRKSPFSRIKTMSADITVQEARAKGYIKGSLKKEEFFRLAKRVTTPQTIYKKQKLDRDDIVDITDFDVVAWLKGEMRIMLDEELARAVLVGDGRPADDEDKILEDHIRPVAFDSELYTTRLNVNIDDANSSMVEVIDAIALNRKDLRGSGLPTFWTSETYIARMLLLKDNTGRKLYKNIDELATDMRVAEIVSVEILEEYPDLVGVLFNPTDYVVGADKGGAVSMFDDFDIDYNQYKYLIETRASGALVKMKAAMVVMKVAATDTPVVPAAPTFDGTAVTIVDTAGVTYRNAETDAVMTAAGSPYAVPAGDAITVNAEAAAGRYFASSDDDSWTFNNAG